MAMWCIFSVNQHIQYSFNFNVWKMSTFSFSPVIVNNLKIIWTLRHSFASTRNNAENLVEISKSKSVYELKYGIQHFYNSIKMICFIQINNLSVLYSYSFHVNLNSYAYACVCVGHVHGFYQPILNIWCISFFCYAVLSFIVRLKQCFMSFLLKTSTNICMHMHMHTHSGINININAHTYTLQDGK